VAIGHCESWEKDDELIFTDKRCVQDIFHFIYPVWLVAAMLIGISTRHPTAVNP
jgi:hypothetical protein